MNNDNQQNISAVVGVCKRKEDKLKKKGRTKHKWTVFTILAKFSGFVMTDMVFQLLVLADI